MAAVPRAGAISDDARESHVSMMADQMPNAAAFESARYWQDRYLAGGTSGAGSYGRLAVYKAHVINELAYRRSLGSVVEFGSGDGNQASLFSLGRYTGVDVSDAMVLRCNNMFADRKGWVFQTLAAYDAAPVQAQLAMSLDVIYHLVEDDVFHRYMARLFAAATEAVLIYATDEDLLAPGVHVRHRAYSDWISQNAQGWSLQKTWKQPFPAKPGAKSKNNSAAFFRLFLKETTI